ncbi:MAG TPA: hemolysin family protein [Mycobacteriales bacterium]|jgi:CBS domain containing-hemolysin-like protein
MTRIDVLLPLAAFALLTAGNAIFVTAEYSLITVDRALVHQRSAAGDPGARRIEAALRSLSFQLSGAQFGITVASLLTGYLAEPALARLFRPVLSAVGVTSLDPAASRSIATGLALAVATLVSMLFGELLPKNAALARPMALALITVPIQTAFSTVFRPIILALNGAANWVVRRLGIEPQEELASARSPEELGLLAAISARAGALPSETATLLQRTIRFGDKRAAEAMTPRVDVVGMPSQATVADLFALSRVSGFSRFPVYVETLDHVVGIAPIADALAVPEAKRHTTPVDAIAREPLLVPESLRLDEVLRRLRQEKRQMAIVVDEYGGTDGIITAEDLAEELVGEIEDEYDDPEDAHPTTTAGATVTSPDAHSGVLVSGMLRGDELAEQTGFELPDGPFETLAGFLMARLGHIPAEGETVTEDGWDFTVTSVDRHRVEQVQVEPPARAEAS